MTDNIIAVADRLAESAHKGQRDKAGKPYVGHVRRGAVHVARVTAVDCLTIYVTWPEYLVPVPNVGSVIQVSAYLIPFVPGLWIQVPVT